ncbi:hypothetical protein SOVF_046310 [Spinacia oleracea]|nr:hypothetical protein SOVF_046310 [Spinacia oleracea]
MQSDKGYNSKISKEEERIKEELEIDIEKDLEGEIKDEIHRLALRLHRLHQHRRHKQQPPQPPPPPQQQQQRNKGNKSNRAVSEVNISIIKMEGGGTKVEIKEIKKKKKPNYDNNNNNNNIIISSNGRINVVNKKKCSKNGIVDHKRFDWANSLRSGPLKSGHGKKIQIRKE